MALAVVLVSGVSVAGFAAWDLTRTFAEDAVEIPQDAPLPPNIGEIEGGVNLLLTGTDKCEPEYAEYFGPRCTGPDAGGELNDVTMLLHVSEEPRRVTVISFPRDMIVRIPSCTDENGRVHSAMSGQMINTTYSYGGLACTALTVSELTGQPGLCATMVKILTYKLHMIDHFIAEPGRKQLHEIPIWLELGQPGPYVRYCGSREQLLAEGANPDKLGAVEVRDPQRMTDWAMLQQSDVLGELAQAYYDRHEAENDYELRKKAWDALGRARDNVKYRRVLQFDGQHVPSPALSDGLSRYFADLMQSYFLVNDHYPFIRCELKNHDPAGYALIAGLWEGNPRR